MIQQEIEDLEKLPFQTQISSEILKKLTSIFHLGYKTFVKTNEIHENIKLLENLVSGVFSLKEEAQKEKSKILFDSTFSKPLREPITDEQYELLMIEAYSLHMKNSKTESHLFENTEELNLFTETETEINVNVKTRTRTSLISSSKSLKNRKDVENFKEIEIEDDLFLPPIYRRNFIFINVYVSNRKKFIQ